MAILKANSPHDALEKYPFKFNDLIGDRIVKSISASKLPGGYYEVEHSDIKYDREAELLNSAIGVILVGRVDP